MPRVAGDATRHESAPLVACPSLPPPSSAQRLLCTSLARHCVPPHPCRRHLRALGTLDLEWPCATRPHRPPLGGLNMECTNGQPAGYRRHREQSNPNAASRDQNGANKNPLHHRGFYRPPGCSCKSPHDREPTSGLEPLTPAHYECAARHLGATERLTSRTATSSPNASTNA